jgi:hypothetical protein
MYVDMKVFFLYYSEEIVQAMCNNQDVQFIHFSFSSYSLINGQPKELPCINHKIYNKTKCSKFSTKPSTSTSTNQRTLATL